MKRTINFLAFVTVATIFYLGMLQKVEDIELRLDAELQLFDLDGNGTFTLNERTEAQQLAMKNVISDTGRNFAPYTLIPGSMLFGVLLVFLTNVFLRNFEKDSIPIT